MAHVHLIILYNGDFHNKCIKQRNRVDCNFANILTIYVFILIHRISQIVKIIV